MYYYTTNTLKLSVPVPHSYIQDWQSLAQLQCGFQRELHLILVLFSTAIVGLIVLTVTIACTQSEEVEDFGARSNARSSAPRDAS